MATLSSGQHLGRPQKATRQIIVLVVESLIQLNADGEGMHLSSINTAGRHICLFTQSIGVDVNQQLQLCLYAASNMSPSYQKIQRERYDGLQ
jgi:hypothetical protein